MKPKCEENINLMYMDTDSFIYDIKTIDFYDGIRFEIDHHFDTSEYDKDNVFKLSLINKKKLGMMKDECRGNIIKKCIGLRAKMYSIQISNMNNAETTEIKKTRKNAIVEYLDYHIPVTQIMGPKGNGDMQAESEIEMRHLPAVDRFKRYGR